MNEEQFDRMEAMNELYQKLLEPFGSADDLDELLMQSLSMGNLLNVLAMQHNHLIYNLVNAVRESIPREKHGEVIRRYRTHLSRTIQQCEQIRADNMRRMREQFGEGWKEGNPQEWTPDDDQTEETDPDYET